MNLGIRNSYMAYQTSQRSAAMPSPGCQYYTVLVVRPTHRPATQLPGFFEEKNQITINRMTNQPKAEMLPELLLVMRHLIYD